MLRTIVLKNPSTPKDRQQCTPTMVSPSDAMAANFPDPKSQNHTAVGHALDPKFTSCRMESQNNTIVVHALHMPATKKPPRLTTRQSTPLRPPRLMQPKSKGCFSLVLKDSKPSSRRIGPVQPMGIRFKIPARAAASRPTHVQPSQLSEWKNDAASCGGLVWRRIYIHSKATAGRSSPKKVGPKPLCNSAAPTSNHDIDRWLAAAVVVRTQISKSKRGTHIINRGRCRLGRPRGFRHRDRSRRNMRASLPP